MLSDDKTLKVWDATTGQEILTLRGHTQFVTSVAFSPDGKRLASGSLDGTLKLWDATSGDEILTLRGGHNNIVTSVAFSPDGKRLASANYHNTVMVWDATAPLKRPAQQPSLDFAQVQVIDKNGLKFDANLTADDARDKLRNSFAKTIRVKLFKGKTYQIDMKSKQIDSYLRLESSAGLQLAEDDDSGGFPDARIFFHCPADGVYRIIATTFISATGPFTLMIREVSPIQEREQRAIAHFQKANQLRNSGQFKAAIAEYRPAIDIWAKLAAEFPDVVGHALNLGSACCNLGHSLRDTQDSEQALSFYGKSLAAMEPLLQKDPVPANARLFLRNTHWGRAKALGQLKRHEDASKDWQQAIELDVFKMPEFRTGLARSLVHHDVLDKAVKSAEGLAKDKLPPIALYDLACMYGVCAGKVKDDAGKQEEYARRALQFLDKARQAGWFNNPSQRERIKTESDLDPLRSRQDFKKLNEELETAYRFQSACLAVRTAAGRGLNPQKEGEQDKAKLRAQALAWLRADLDSYAAQIEAGKVDGMVLAIDKLALWQKVADLATVREPQALALLPEGEQEPWRKLWADANRVLDQAKAGFITQTTLKGALTAGERQQTHDMKLTAGTAYIIDMHSTSFDTYLKLLDEKGKLLDENDDIAPDNHNSRLLFTPKQDGTFRIVATSFQQNGMGAYTLTVRTLKMK